MLLLIKVFKDSIAEGKTAIRVCKGKIVNDVAFANPFIALILTEMEREAIRLFFGCFCIKAHMILFLCDDSKSLFGQCFITENIMESLLDTVELRDIIAVLPTVQSRTVKCSQKVSDLFIGHIGNRIEHIVTQPP